jgi:hypothetical protein
MNEAARQSLIQPESRSNLIANDLVLACPAGTPADFGYQPSPA